MNIIADAALDRPTTGTDTLIGLIVIAVGIAVVLIVRSPDNRRSVGRATGAAVVGTVRATGRPIRALGRRSRSGAIGYWGRSVVGCEDRSIAAAAEGKHGASRFWRSLGDALVGSTRLSCHVPDCTWSQDRPSPAEFVEHLRGHSSRGAPTEKTTEKPTEKVDSTADQIGGEGTNTTPQENEMSESIPELATALDTRLIPAAQREVDASEAMLARLERQRNDISATLDNMDALGIPAMTRTIIEAALESAVNAVSAAQKTLFALHEVNNSMQSVRDGIRGQEAVAEAASAAGGAMHQSAYSE